MFHLSVPAHLAAHQAHQGQEGLRPEGAAPQTQARRRGGEGGPAQAEGWGPPTNHQGAGQATAAAQCREPTKDLGLPACQAAVEVVREAHPGKWSERSFGGGALRSFTTEWDEGIFASVDLRKKFFLQFVNA